jgi:signal recognition particle subunit SRP54
MFDALSSKISGAFASLRNKGKLSSSDIEKTISEIRDALLEADVALVVADGFAKRVDEKAQDLLANAAIRSKPSASDIRSC